MSDYTEEDLRLSKRFLALHSPFREQQDRTRQGEQYGWQREEELLAAFRAEARRKERKALRDKIAFYVADKKSDADRWTLELIITFLDAREKGADR